MILAAKIRALLDGRYARRRSTTSATSPRPPCATALILNFEGEAEGHHDRGGRPDHPRRCPARDRRVAGPGALPVSENQPAAVADRPGRAIFLPAELDPTVFDEAFLRQLERLLLLVRAPVRGGLKGGRRSVKRGQSVEFADYRDYTLGDDLRQLDWNVYARLERLLVKLFVEEEDLTVTLLVDASASMAGGQPEKLRFAKRAAAALGYVGLASEDRITVSALGGRASRRQVALRGSGRVFRLLTALSGITVADGPTRPRRGGPPRGGAVARPGPHRAAERPARSRGRDGHPGPCRHRLGARDPPHPGP